MKRFIMIHIDSFPPFFSFFSAVRKAATNDRATPSHPFILVREEKNVAAEEELVYPEEKKP